MKLVYFIIKILSFIKITLFLNKILNFVKN